jgi:hypothetical protein
LGIRRQPRLGWRKRKQDAASKQKYLTGWYRSSGGPFMLPCKYLRLDCFDDDQVVAVGLQTRRGIGTRVHEV